MSQVHQNWWIIRCRSPPHGSLTLWGKEGGKLPLELLPQGAGSSQSLTKELVHIMPCLFWLCDGRILKPSWTFISRKWSPMGLTVTGIGPLQPYKRHLSILPFTLPLLGCPGCSTWWSLGVWMRVLRGSCFAYITEILAGFPTLLSSSPNFEFLL